jgi:hypothetical protein
MYKWIRVLWVHRRGIDERSVSEHTFAQISVSENIHFIGFVSVDTPVSWPPVVVLAVVLCQLWGRRYLFWDGGICVSEI